MKKAIGFLGGQFGDAVITLGLQKAFTDDNPDVEFTFALSKKYADILPLFENQPHIDKTHAWEGYDNEWPTENDRKFILEQKFDYVFNPMQRQDPEFFLKCHQVTSVCRMYDYRDPNTNKVSLVKNFEILPAFRGTVALCLFPNNGTGIKSLSVEKANRIAAYVKKLGFNVAQLGGKDEPRIAGATKWTCNYETSVQILTSCAFAVVGDTGLSWVASAYDLPIVGLYAGGYYPLAPNCKNWQPINNEAIYLDRFAAEDILDESIFNAIEEQANRL